MRALIQRVSEATVDVEEGESSSIGRGLVVFLGIGQEDTQAEADRLYDKIVKLRVFEDDEGKTNRSLGDVGGRLMVVSQFTLYANCKKGNRPSFTQAAGPELGEQLYERFLERAHADGILGAHGEFGAMMHVSLVNEGPFTVWLDTEAL